MTNSARHKVVAHRGYQKHYPENTLLAMEKAIAAGALYLETDIQLSADCVPLLYHDVDMSRLSGLATTLFDYSWRELQQIGVIEPGRLPNKFHQTICSLQQFVSLLQQHPEVTPFIEIKQESNDFFGMEKVLLAICEVLEPISDRAVLISFDINCIAAARANGWSKVGVVLNNWQQKDDSLVQQIAPDYIYADVRDLPPEGDLTLTGITTVIYEVADTTIAHNLFNRGIDMIETFAAGEMITQLS